MDGEPLTMFAMLFVLIGLIGGMVAGSIIRTQRLGGFGWAVAALTSTHIAWVESDTRVAFFVMTVVLFVISYIASVVRTRAEQKSPSQGV